MKRNVPTPLEKELLLDLLEVEDQFLGGKLQGTVRSQVIYRMASRRGRTLPAPVPHKVQTDHRFLGVFTRTLGRLVSAGLVRSKAIGRKGAGLPYQWGFAHHDRRERDIFLTPEGRDLAQALRPEEPPAPKGLTVEFVDVPPPKAGPRRRADEYDLRLGLGSVSWTPTKKDEK
jgi:hypothetical protein